MSIIAPQTTIQQSPPAWAAATLPSDGAPTFVSAETVLEVHAPDGSDAGRVYSSLEQVGQGDPAIRLQGSGNQPMTLAQAWRLSTVLQDLVRRALSGQAVAR